MNRAAVEDSHVRIDNTAKGVFTVARSGQN